MDFKSLQAAIGIGGPKVAQEAGPVGGGLIADPISDERKKWKESMDAQQGYKKGGKVSSASSRADGCAQRGKTRGKVV